MKDLSPVTVSKNGGKRMVFCSIFFRVYAESAAAGFFADVRRQSANILTHKIDGESQPGLTRRSGPRRTVVTLEKRFFAASQMTQQTNTRGNPPSASA